MLFQSLLQLQAEGNMPADEDLPTGVTYSHEGERYGIKVSARSSTSNGTAAIPPSFYSTSSYSSSSGAVGFGVPYRSSDSMVHGQTTVYSDSIPPPLTDEQPSSLSISTAEVTSVCGVTSTGVSSVGVSSVRPGLTPQETSFRYSSPGTSPTPRNSSSVYVQHSCTPEHCVTAPERTAFGFPSVVVPRANPDSTPTVTISCHLPSSTPVGRLRGGAPASSTTPSAQTSSSSNGLSYSSPSFATSSQVPSICTSVPSSSMVSPLSLSFPSVSLSPYLGRPYSPSTTRIVRASSASSAQHQSPVARRALPPLRMSEPSSSALDQVLSAGSRASSVGASSERSARFHHGLALTHLASHDAIPPPCLHSPPPSYDQLCNPNALPTYQEATQNSSKRRGDGRTIFTLPSHAEPVNTDPLLQTYVVQDGERGLRGGVLASLAAELSDSEGGYSTILDAIPHEHTREPCPTVPVRFLSTCSLQRLRPPKVQPPCLTSVCNKALVRKELNRRWPFIAGAQEDDSCPGLILVECSSHLTVAHLPEPPRSTDGGHVSVNISRSSGGGGGISGFDNLTDITLGSPTISSAAAAAATIDLDAAALTSQVMFYLCGKCVGYDSFDKENVRSHIEYDCPGNYNQWGNMNELYLFLRAVLFVIIVIIVFVWLPYFRF